MQILLENGLCVEEFPVPLHQLNSPLPSDVGCYVVEIDSPTFDGREFKREMRQHGIWQPIIFAATATIEPAVLAATRIAQRIEAVIRIAIGHRALRVGVSCFGKIDQPDGATTGHQP